MGNTNLRAGCRFFCLRAPSILCISRNGSTSAGSRFRPASCSKIWYENRSKQLNRIFFCLLRDRHLQTSYIEDITWVLCSCIIEFIKQVGRKDKMRGYAEHLIGFPLTTLINSIILEHQRTTPFIIWHLNRILLANFEPKHHDFAIRKRNVFMDVNA